MVFHSNSTLISRRRFVAGAGAGTLAASSGLVYGQAHNHDHHPTASQVNTSPQLEGAQQQLTVGYQAVNFTGRDRLATTINQSLPAPILRWKEGQEVRVRVTNGLAHPTSIHWHGIILPTGMDGVPGLSFDAIAPGASFDYHFTVQQSGTYWYHSHSGWQEQTGVYGAIIIDPAEPDPVAYDREHVILLSDWMDEDPADAYAKLKKQSDYYNTRERTVGDLWQDIKRKGVVSTWKERQMWNTMRMSDRDISDVTGYTYTFLMNGQTPASQWTGLYKAGEKVRLRIINGAAMTLFDFRIPGLKMTVVAADGQNVDPVTVDEFRIGIAETYDVIVEPDGDAAYTVFAQSIDRSGYAVGMLTTDPALRSVIPAMDAAPILTHADMGMAMNHDGMNHHAMSHSAMSHKTMNHEGMDHSAMNHEGIDHTAMNHSQGNKEGHNTALDPAGMGSQAKIHHVNTEFGPQVDMRSMMPMSGLHDPGIGLRDHQQRLGRKVLTYGDLRNLTPTRDAREPEREIQLHLTGNMQRYMWSMNGIKFADADPLRLTYGERVRITLVNDTMMTHPIHLHGMWSELETGDPAYIPRKHTILVQPGAKISYLVTADALGRWAYHCHLMFHMPGMFREVRVEKTGQHTMHSHGHHSSDMKGMKKDSHKMNDKMNGEEH